MRQANGKAGTAWKIPGARAILNARIPVSGAVSATRKQSREVEQIEKSAKIAWKAYDFEARGFRQFLACTDPECKTTKRLAVGRGQTSVPDIRTDEKCPQCGHLIKQGRYGEFTACGNYPE